MRRLTTSLLALAALGAIAVPSAGAAATGPAGVPTAQAPFDQQFIDVMAAHHEGAIAMARIALKRSKAPAVRKLAGGIIRAQTAELTTMHRLRKQWYGSSTFKRYAMSDEQMRMMGMEPGMDAMLRRSMSFDRMFMTMMIPHHAGAIVMARWEMTAGKYAELKRIARGEYVAQSREIGRMIALLRGRPEMM